MEKSIDATMYLTSEMQKHNITCNRDLISSGIVDGTGRVILHMPEADYWTFCDLIGNVFSGTDAKVVNVKISVPID